MDNNYIRTLVMGMLFNLICLVALSLILMLGNVFVSVLGFILLLFNHFYDILAEEYNKVPIRFVQVTLGIINFIVILIGLIGLI